MPSVRACLVTLMPSFMSDDFSLSWGIDLLSSAVWVLVSLGLPSTGLDTSVA